MRASVGERRAAAKVTQPLSHRDLAQISQRDKRRGLLWQNHLKVSSDSLPLLQSHLWQWNHLLLCWHIKTMRGGGGTLHHLGNMQGRTSYKHIFTDWKVLVSWVEGISLWHHPYQYNEYQIVASNTFLRLPRNRWTKSIVLTPQHALNTLKLLKHTDWLTLSETAVTSVDMLPGCMKGLKHTF